MVENIEATRKHIPATFTAREAVQSPHAGSENETHDYNTPKKSCDGRPVFCSRLCQAGVGRRGVGKTGEESRNVSTYSAK